MDRKTWIIIGSVVVVVALGGLWMRSRTHKAAPKYRTAAVERGDITETVSATGSVEPVLQVQVGSQVSGTLAKLYVDYNSQVKSGQVLAQLETSAFKARLAQAEASVAHAEASLKNGQLSLQRSIELQKKGDFVAQADVDAAQATVDQQKADLKQAQAALQSAQVDLSHTTITSPIDGVVISRSIDVGQTVAASLQAPQLFLIGNDLRRMQVETSIDEADIGRIRPGLQATFTVDAYPDASFSGQVVQVRLVPQVSSNVVTYQTLISARNDDLRLRPGMTANVTIMIETHKDVLKVANAALRFKPAGFNGRRGGNGAGGAGGGGNAGGFRRGFAALLDRIVPPALAQERPQQPGGPGAWPGANDPYVQQVRARVQKGELTRDQGRELIRKHFSDLGITMPDRGQGGPPAGGPGAPGAPAAGAKPGAGAKGARAGVATKGAPQGVQWAGRDKGTWQNLQGLGSAAGSEFKPGAVWVLRDGRPARVHVLTGLTDGSFTEVQSDSLKEGDMVITGTDVASAASSNLTPPPGMGGPGFRGGRR